MTTNPIENNSYIIHCAECLWQTRSSRCGFNAFVVAASRYSSDSWPRPYPQPHCGPQVSPGRDNARSSLSAVGLGVATAFKTFLDMGQTGVRGTWPTRNALGHNKAKQGPWFRQCGNVSGARKSQITCAHVVFNSDTQMLNSAVIREGLQSLWTHIASWLKPAIQPLAAEWWKTDIFHSWHCIKALGGITSKI